MTISDFQKPQNIVKKRNTAGHQNHFAKGSTGKNTTTKQVNHGNRNTET